MDLESLKALGVEGDAAGSLIERFSELESGITKLKDKNEQLIGEKRTVSGRLTDFESRFKDVDPDQYNEMRTKLSEIDENNLMDKSKFEELNIIRDKKMSEELSSRDMKYGGLLDKYKENLKDVAINNAVIAAKGKKSLAKVLRQDVKTIEDGDDYSVVVIDEKGEIRLNETGSPMSPTEYANLLREDEDYQGLYNLHELNGGSASQSKSSAGGVNKMSRADFESKTPAEQSKFIRNGGTVV